MARQKTATAGGETLRADAQENRDRIVDVAHRLLEQSPDASLTAIAKAAGVGAGTLYRRFPNREALIVEVYLKEIRQLADLAPALLREHPPLDAMRLWLNRLADYGRIKHAIAHVLRATMTDGLVGDTHTSLANAVDTLLRACEAAGTIRSGIDAEDVLLLLAFLWRAPPGTLSEARVSKLLDLVLAGLRRVA